MTHTNFTPQADGFAFINSWTFDQDEADEVRRLLNEAVNRGLLLLGPVTGGTLILTGIGHRLMELVSKSVPQTYGLCGGMAFAALDYYTEGTRIPSGMTQPTRETPEGKTLRDYLWQRQLDSFRANLPTVLQWMAMLNLVPQWWIFKSDAPWLFDRTKEEWAKLKGFLDAGQPRPIALLGTTSDPCENHQVLAYDYEQADGQVTLYVYDMNCPGTPQTIQLDFRGPILSAVESCPNPNRGTLRGFICEAYEPARPPLVMDFTRPGAIPT